jgi:signal transduction histidine kinase
MKFVLPTYFAPAKRAASGELQRSMELACMNPVIDGVMRSVGGMVAVLNEHRQILTVNDELLRMIGINDGGAVLGLRPGEVLRCDHAREMPGGCGTSRYCSSCGTAIAIVASLKDGMASERKCVLTVSRKGRPEELCLAVRAHPMQLEGQRLVLLFLQDITVHEWRAALERVFFHDINNTLQGLVGTSFMMEYLDDKELRKMVKPLQLMMSRLSKEVKIESSLSGRDPRNYRPELRDVAIPLILEEMKSVFFPHPVSDAKQLHIVAPATGLKARTDPSLLSRILTNMLKNAFEATETGGEVRLAVGIENGSLFFTVWNRASIPEAVALRVFQRHFSTRSGAGRGFGTYSMRFFGEDVLGGKVDFMTSEEAGTTFRFTLPPAK